MRAFETFARHEKEIEYVKITQNGLSTTMHRLDRPNQEPTCLQRYRQGNYEWKDVTRDDKEAIWQSLRQMQNHRCAYCEIHICETPGKNHNGHIEHFWQRRRYPQGMFEWSNLFGSCDRTDSCGRHKDNQSYHPHNLIKMDIENPGYFLKFFPDGHVDPVENLNPKEHKRAEETIRVFNLNGALRQIRERHVKGYIQTAEALLEIAETYGLEEWSSFLQEELTAVSGKPFETAIRDVLRYAQ